METSNTIMSQHRAKVEKLLEVNQFAGQRMKELSEEAAESALKIFSTSMTTFRTQLATKDPAEAFELQTKLMQETFATATECANRMLELGVNFAKRVVAQPGDSAPARPAKQYPKPS